MIYALVVHFCSFFVFTTNFILFPSFTLAAIKGQFANVTFLELNDLTTTQPQLQQKKFYRTELSAVFRSVSFKTSAADWSQCYKKITYY
jgi:hypothetical protein